MELPKKPPVRSYKTEFRKNESPISEGGMWLNGRKDGIGWCDILVKDGVAYGEVSRNQKVERRAEQAALGAGAGASGLPEGDYDDPTAVLTGQWGPNQYGKARIFSRNQTDKYFQEAQIRLRHNMKPNFCNGYEVFFRVLDSEAGYAEIVRWNGPVGGWTSLKKLVGKKYGVKDGDIIEASIVGNVITGYLNGVEMISVVDDHIKSGAPGIGFNFGVGTTNADHGMTSFEVHTYD
ncbi:MAG TPA: hypothetical protein VM659_04970 [Dongiaceae bacterium]|nr:hypothetical protein [Dongiaceae bacterium]